MKNKKNCTIFPVYRSNEIQKGTLYYISFKLLCLSLYIIGFYYVLLNNSLENGSLEISKNCNIYKRNLVQVEKSKGQKSKKHLKHRKDVNKTKDNENNIKGNAQQVDENKNSIKNNGENSNVEKKSNVSTCNINYNDMSKNLTEIELYEVLNSFEECPPNDDLRNIWKHSLAVAKEGFDNILKELKGKIQNYLDNDIQLSNGKLLYKDTWDRIDLKFCRTVAIEEAEYTRKFYSLINDKHTINDVVKLIYSFIENFNTLKEELHENCEKELLENVNKIANRKKY
ncbi:hypothetical protein PFMG_04256 [Plasmodium falciparum IGH-CR14]|uniref:Plasmodium RESA N-terminal domain-containing protein n=2 Tax=Plasmodium falciparum TaxID=5833 RepID=A0A0L1IEZ6_PLAFA|nr:hypothetical protein PFFVO_00871 [Plasmodium falciparum Vietnam Oak-Knoll (FVO)]KNG78201.1 hypothetical protein PFMG_04256 [Plasmodium falciparum IGH-CR14]